MTRVGSVVYRVVGCVKVLFKLSELYVRRPVAITPAKDMCMCHVESCPLRLSGDYVRPVDSVLVVHCAVSFRSLCAVPCSGKAGGRKQALEAARPQAGLWSHGRRYVRARSARGRYACVEWPAGACPAPLRYLYSTQEAGTRRAYVQCEGPGMYVSAQALASSSPSVGRKRWALWYTMMAG